MNRFFYSFCLLLLPLFALAQQNVYQQVRLYVNSEDGVYQPGDTVKVTAKLYEAGPQTVLMQVISYDRVLSKKEMTLSDGDVVYTEVCSEPVSKMVKVSPVGDAKTSTTVGYLVAPQDFVPGFATPANLRSFWEEQVKNLRALKPEVKIFPAERMNEQSKDKVECYKFEINMPEGRPCRGYLAYPKGAEPGSLPIYLFVHSAGVNRSANPHSASFVTSRALQGYLCVDVNAHGYKADQPQAYYDALDAGELKAYHSRPFTGLSDYYFHNMYLRDIRGLDYAVTLPVWDGKRILVHGESQGGGQALALAGIDSRITHCVAIVPAITDIGACLDGRKCGWPARSNALYAPTPLGPTVMAYHDGAILVSLFKGDLYMESGNIDITCDPAAVCAGYNNARNVKSKQIYYYPWRSHSYTNMEERVRDEWSRQVYPHREAFFQAYLSSFAK